MSYTDVALDTFGGLDLADDPEEVGFAGAVDMLNVSVTSAGRLRQRDGTLLFIANSPARAVVYFGSTVVVSWDTNNLGVYDSGTGVGSTTTVGSESPYELVRFGIPGNSAVFFPDGSTLSYWDGSSFHATGSITARSVAQSPTANRLVLAEAFSSKVWFSDAGDPLTYQVNNFEQLDPGDDETVLKLVTWGDQVFAFKQTKFFVFYGEHTDGTGQPVFDYRAQRNGVGLPAGSHGLATAGPDGVYFANSDGVYRTVGAAAVKVSGAIEPWFRDETLPLAINVGALTGTGQWEICADSRFVYLRVSSTRTFVYDTQTERWSVSGLAVACLAQQDTTRLISTTDGIAKYSPAYTDDDGTPIDWAYRTGATDLGYPESKLVKQLQVWGSGTVIADVYADHATTDAGQTTLTLGTAPAVARATQMRSRQGTFFSVGLSGTGPATVNRAILGVAERRLAGVS